MKKRKELKNITGKVILIILVALIVVGILNPDLLFFLTPSQKEVINDFQNTYFTSRNPIQSAGGSFDPFCLVSLALLVAECWAINTLVNLVDHKLTLKSNHAETVKGLICNCLKYAVVIYGIVFGLSILGANMVAIITSLGVLSLIIGFGAQTLIEDIITGLFLIFEGQFHVGDIVTIDDFRGVVTSIGIRTTQLTDAGGNIKIINNSDIHTVLNLSNKASAAVVDVGISYDADLEKAEQTIFELLDKLPSMYPDVFKEKPSYSGVQNLAASSVDLRVVAHVNETEVYHARRLLNRELKLALDRSGIEIPFQQVVIHHAPDEQ